LNQGELNDIFTYQVLEFGRTCWSPSKACTHHQCSPWLLKLKLKETNTKNMILWWLKEI